MEVYHASTVVVDGSGFYFTALQGLAVKYGTHFTNRGKETSMNIYEHSQTLSVH